MDKNWQKYHDLRLEQNSLIERKKEMEKRRKNRLNRLNLALYKKFFPRAKEFNYSKIKDNKEWVDFCKVCNNAAQKISAKIFNKEKRIIGRMNDLAEILEVKTRKECRELFHCIYISTYSSQGFGDERYAHVSAKLSLDKAKYFGIDGEVVKEGDKFCVYVFTSAVEVEVLKLKHLPTEIFVKNCWSYGCQPRVFIPFLPHDYEKEHGINFW